MKLLGMKAYYRRRLRNGSIRVYFRSDRATATFDMDPATAARIPRNVPLTLDGTIS